MDANGWLKTPVTPGFYWATYTKPGAACTGELMVVSYDGGDGRFGVGMVGDDRLCDVADFAPAWLPIMPPSPGGPS